ncbi:MAG: hypothetical protein ACXV3F_04915 [Frankiaceae bacterium]
MDRDTDGAADTERAVLVGIVLLVALPVLGLAVANGPYGPTEDHALLELGVRRVVAGHPPTLGVYSRFGWYHPGPALYYLLAGPYLLLGGSSMALPVAALAVNAMCLAAVALLMRRHRGLLAALWALLVCLLYLRQLPGSFLLEVWNPYLPMLPFLVAALLCWAALQGDRWALPVALVILSACVQAHVSYAVGAAALLAVTVVLLVWLRRRRGVPGPTPRGWAIGGAATLLLWLPPLWQQVAATGGGNLSALAAGLGGRAPDAPGPGAALRLVGTELGRLPAFVFGIRPGPSVGGPAHWSVQLGLAAVAVLGLAALIATGGRDRSGLLLVVVAGTVAAAAAFSVTRVRPPLIDYLVQWATVAGILVWISVGVVLLRRAEPLLRACRGSLHRRWPVVALWALLVPLIGLLVGLVVARNAGLPPSDPNPRVLATGIARWLPRPADGVSVEYGGTVTPVYLGTMAVGAGVVLELDKQGVPVRPPATAEFGFAQVLPAWKGTPRWTVVVGLAGNVAPLPPGFVEVARSDTLVALARPNV